ncbi:MAG: peptidyl-prolyl cis-trans isomerase [candidate division WOR-3 bacterium]
MISKTIVTLILTLTLVNVACAQSPAEQLVRIRKLYLTNEYQKALQQLNDALPKIRDYNTKALYLTEIGDIYLDKLHDYTNAENTYKAIIRDYPKYKDIAGVIYRLGLTYEKQERFLDAAQAYEQVATKYMKTSYGNDALDAIERCFKKNYQELVAKVDNYPITRLEFDDRVSQAPSRYEKFEDKQKLLDDMIDERLLYLAAMEKNLQNNPDVITRLTEMRNSSLSQEWYNRTVLEKVKVSEGEKKSYYKKNKKTRFTTPERVRAREILVKTKEEAEALRSKIIAESLPFDSVAKETSQAPNKKSGGDMGYFKRGTHPKEIEDVAFRLKIGEISPPIATKDGFVLLKVEDKKPTEVRTYDKVTREIENTIRQEKTDKLFKKVSEELKKQYRGFIDTMAIKQNKETLGIVDDQPITNQQLQERINKIPPFYRQGFESTEGKKRLCDQMLLEQIILREIEEQKLWLSNKFISQFEPRRVQTLIQTLRKLETTDKVQVDTIEMKKDYQATIKDFKVPEQVRAREIVVKSDTQAARLRKEALAGKISFDSLAKEYSIAPTKWQGGDMGYFSRGSKPKEIEDAVFGLEKGKITKVIKLSDTSYTFLKVEDKKKAYTRPFSEVKEKIERKIRRQKEEKLYQDLIADLRNKAKIEKFLTQEPPQEETPSPEEKK